jgi:hypothetical protein
MNQFPQDLRHPFASIVEDTKRLSRRYGHANGASQFKTMAHEIFGVPRSDSEHWSLAYPWERPGSAADRRGEIFSAFQEQISEVLKG